MERSYGQSVYPKDLNKEMLCLFRRKMSDNKKQVINQGITGEKGCMVKRNKKELQKAHTSIIIILLLL